LDSLTKQIVRPGLTLVVDNSPDADAKDVVEHYAAKLPIEYLAMGYNSGPAGAFAAGINRLAGKAEWMMCRGDDNPFDRHDILERMKTFAIRTAERKPAGLGITGGRFDARRALSLRLGVGFAVVMEARR
jgi:GT2 family glycosyltransferase